LLLLFYFELYLFGMTWSKWRCVRDRAWNYPSARVHLVVCVCIMSPVEWAVIGSIHSEKIKDPENLSALSLSFSE